MSRLHLASTAIPNCQTVLDNVVDRQAFDSHRAVALPCPSSDRSTSCVAQPKICWFSEICHRIGGNRTASAAERHLVLVLVPRAPRDAAASMKAKLMEEIQKMSTNKVELRNENIPDISCPTPIHSSHVNETQQNRRTIGSFGAGRHALNASLSPSTCPVETT